MTHPPNMSCFCSSIFVPYVLLPCNCVLSDTVAVQNLQSLSFLWFLS